MANFQREVFNAALPVYGEREARAIARLAVEKLASEKVSASDGSTGAATISAASIAFIAEICARISLAEPIQYVLGTASFYDLELAVGQGVLIPRPETEELVRWILDDAKSRDGAREAGLRILDIGTGSGAIAIALAKNLPTAQVAGIDISTAALAFARRNNDKYSAGVEFFQADILELASAPPASTNPAHLVPSAGLDVIVSNPPYIPASEKALMHDNVTRWEPAKALFVPDDDPLVFYRVAARFARRALAPRGALTSGGTLYLEIHENFAAETVELLRAEGFSNIEVREDLNSKPRMVKCAL